MRTRPLELRLVSNAAVRIRCRRFKYWCKSDRLYSITQCFIDSIDLVANLLASLCEHNSLALAYDTEYYSDIDFFSLDCDPFLSTFYRFVYCVLVLADFTVAMLFLMCLPIRPELVRRSENPLCSDAYSKRSSGNEIQRREIKIIYNRLLKDDVPAFARWLCNKLEDISQRDRSIESVIKNLLEAQKQSLCSSSNSDSFASSWNDNGSDTSDSEYLAGDSTSEQRQRRGAVKATKRLYHEFSRLKTLSHHFGINLRLLGHVRSAVPKRSLWRSVVLAECSCRTLKNLHRKDLRALAWKLRFQQHRQVVEPLFRQEALRFFNTVFGETPASSSFWEEVVRKGLTERFPDVLEKAEKAPLKSMVRQLLPYIAINLAAYLGYSLSDNIAQQLYDTTSFSLLARERPFSESDLEMREKIKQLPLISYGARVCVMSIECFSFSLDHS